MKHGALKTLIDHLGKKYSEILGINLVDAEGEEIFKWFLASVFFGAPIRGNSVVKTYRCFEKYNVLTPQRIFETGWDGLVKILDEGGYTRYDFKTADKLPNVMRNLIEKYGRSLKCFHERASDCEDLERRLKDLGRGIGDVTVSIFFERAARHLKKG